MEQTSYTLAGVTRRDLVAIWRVIESVESEGSHEGTNALPTRCWGADGVGRGCGQPGRARG